MPHVHTYRRHRTIRIFPGRVGSGRRRPDLCAPSTRRGGWFFGPAHRKASHEVSTLLLHIRVNRAMLPFELY